MQNTLLVWAVMGIVGFCLGNIKGRALFGFALGLLLGPIGWILVLCFQNVGVKCAACCKAIDENASICPYCRTPQQKDAAAVPPPPLPAGESLARTVTPRISGATITCIALAALCSTVGAGLLSNRVTATKAKEAATIEKASKAKFASAQH